MITVQIDNPDYRTDYADGRHGNVRRVQATMNMRESPITWMWAKRKQTGITEQQVAAAAHFRKLYEAAGAQVQALDYTREPVDGGGITEPISDRMIKANQQLSEAHAALGAEGFDLIQKVCGECQFLNQISSQRSVQDKLSRDLKNCLETLAVFWGYQAPRTRAYRRAS